MTTLKLVDLDSSAALVRSAMAALLGGNSWVLRTATVVSGAWSAQQRFYYQSMGRTTHDNYPAWWSLEGWKRSRTQTEYSYWDHFVKV